MTLVAIILNIAILIAISYVDFEISFTRYENGYYNMRIDIGIKKK